MDSCICLLITHCSRLQADKSNKVLFISFHIIYLFMRKNVTNAFKVYKKFMAAEKQRLFSYLIALLLHNFKIL